MSVEASPPPELSPILRMARHAAVLREQGHDIIDLTLGEPDFNAPEHVLDAARSALDERLGYAPANGLKPLRDAIRQRLEQTKLLEYDDDQVAVGCGAKQIIFNAFTATLKPGDQVVIPAPYWAAYPDMVRLCGAEPVILTTTALEGFRLTPEHLEAALKLATRACWLILNAPGNPSGAIYSSVQLDALAAVLRRFPHVRVLCDDIYASIHYAERPPTTLAAVAPDLSPRILLVDGVSKAYAMTGWRVGWACGPRDLIRAINSVQSNNCTQTSTLSQKAAIAALLGPQQSIAERNAIYRQRRDTALEVLRGCPDIDVLAPEGAFYLLPKIQGIADDQALAMTLLGAGVAVVPGSAFGMPGHLRLSFATDLASLAQGCRRLTTELGRQSWR